MGVTMHALTPGSARETGAWGPWVTAPTDASDGAGAALVVRNRAFGVAIRPDTGSGGHLLTITTRPDEPRPFLEEMDRIVAELAPGRQAVFVLADRANTATETHVFVLPDGHTTDFYAVLEGGSHG